MSVPASFFLKLCSETGVELFAASVVGKIILYLIFCVFGGGEFPVAFN